MAKIFLSYRRADSGWPVDRLTEYLRQEFGTENIFQDVSSIPLGVDFRDHIRHELESQDIILVIMSSKWAEIMKSRADDKKDVLREEIEISLNLGKTVIPILVDGLAMPDFGDLPESISELQYKNSAQLRRDPDFKIDVDRLIESIRQQLPERHYVEIPEKELPKIDWINIPAGAMITYFKAHPSTRTIGEYFIAKYPVTNREFSKFVHSGFYQNSDYWENRQGLMGSNDDFSFTNYLHDRRLGNPEQPIVGVNWNEAVAYCRWISMMLNEEITLPESNQWQRAAQGDERYIYPWGDEWKSNRCNNSVSHHTYGPTPVKAFEKLGNISPFGVVDMAGNVSEWCLDTAGTASVTNLASRSNLRGSNPEDLRNSVGPMWVGTRLPTLGFRLAKNIDPDSVWEDFIPALG